MSVLKPVGRDSGVCQGQLPFVPSLGTPGLRNGLELVVACAGLRDTGRSYAVNQGKLPLVLGLDPCGHHSVSRGQLPLVSGLWPLS